MQHQHNNAELIDITEVKVERTLPQSGRIIEFVRQIKNPYHFKCNGYSVTARHAADGPSFEDCLQRIIA